MIRYQVILRNHEDTQALAKKLGSVLMLPAVVALKGNLGSGKTTFAQAFAKQLGVTEFLPSPTFTIMNEYTLPEKRLLIHADLYRLHHKNDILATGLSDYFHQSNTISLVEWADRYPPLFPIETVWLVFELVDDYRVVTIHSRNTDFWQRFEGELTLCES